MTQGVDGRRPSLLRRVVKKAAAERFGLWNRRRKAAFLVEFIARHDVRTVVMVGPNSPLQGYGAIVEKAVHAAATVAVGCDLTFPQAGTPWPSVVADGRYLPSPPRRSTWSSRTQSSSTWATRLTNACSSPSTGGWGGDGS